MLKRIVLFGDSRGIPELVDCVDAKSVVAIVGAIIRPNYIPTLAGIAKRLGIPFYIQPKFDYTEDYKEFITKLALLDPDGLLCHSYSMLVRNDVLNLVGNRAFNLHYSLLPRHRGPNPIQWALIHGDIETGATIHVMGKDFDDGAIVGQTRVAIEDSDDWETLFGKVDTAAKVLLRQTIPAILEERWTATPQYKLAVTRNSRIPNDSFPIDFSSMTDRQIFNLIRAQVAPLAGPYIETKIGRRNFNRFVPLKDIPKLRSEFEKS